MALASVTHDGITVESYSATEQQIREAFELPEATDAAAETTETAAEETPEASAEAAQTETVAEPAKIDKRTREGRKASIQAEIDALTATKHATKRELDAAQAELAKLRADLAAVSKAADAKPAETKPARVVDPADPEPDHTDAAKYPAGEYDPKYIRDAAKWDARQEYKAQQAKAAEAAQRAQAESAWRQRYQQYQARVAKFKATTPDFDARLSADLRPTPPMVDVILDSEVGPALSLWLSEHPDDFQRISTLPPAHQLREMGKLEARLDAASRGPASEASTSHAHAPIKPLGGSPPASDDDATDDDLSVEEHIKRENARERARRR